MILIKVVVKSFIIEAESIIIWNDFGVLFHKKLEISVSIRDPQKVKELLKLVPAYQTILVLVSYFESGL